MVNHEKEAKGMQKITREAIKQLASSETVYYRGMRYYAAHAVSNVTWNENSCQYRSVVRGGNQYMVTIRMDEEHGIVYTCNCPSHVKMKGACKHVVATLLFISDYQQRESAREFLEVEDKTAYQIIEYFQKREYRRLTPTYYHLGIRITIPSLLKKQNSKAFLSLSAGAEKMYKVSNTKKFISDYYGENDIQLGKQFHYVAGECAFDEASARVMSYLTEIYEIQETLGKTYYSNLFNRQEMVLSQNMLLKLLRLAEGLECQMSLFGREMEAVDIVMGNPEVSLDMELMEDGLRLKNAGQQQMISLTEDGSILLYDKTVYLPTKDYICNLLPFYSSVFASQEKYVDFRGENKNRFIEKVLPVIKKSMGVTVPQQLRENYVVEQLRPKVYLDITHTKKRYWVSARLEFCYGEYAINPLKENSFSENIILVREREEEERLTGLLYDLKFHVHEELFLLKNEEDIFSLMTENIHVLTENFEVFYSREYKSLNVKKIGNLSASIRLNTDINLLEIDLGYSQIPKEELEEFFRAIRLKRKYYRLKSGAFINLNREDSQLRSLKWMMENSQGYSGGALAFHKSAALYLEGMLPRGSRLDREETYRKLVHDLKHPEETLWSVPKTVQAVLRPYQVVGYQWLKTISYYGMGGILADDMGLGKTLQAIVYICSNPGDRTLIICPTSLAYNWQEEFEKFAPSIRTCIIQGTPEEREALIQESVDKYDVWITTYPLIRKDTKSYQSQQFDHLFLDEAQFIKNPSSLGARAVKSIHAANRFALTGTPIENALSELWSLFDFIMPGFFPRYSRFSDLYEKPILREQNEVRMKELKLRIQPFILRRMKKEVLKELPDKIETKRMAEMTSKQKKIYLSYLSRIQTEMKEQEDLASTGGRMQVLAALTRLRQICCHPGTFIENYQGGSGKLELLMELLSGILEGGHSVIIFSQFTTMLNIISEALLQEGIEHYYLAGATRPEKRKQYVREFNQGKVKVFLISLKAGGTGLNLTGADTVIHYDPWWNPAVEEQATDRAYRIGQRKKVQVIRLIMKDSIEEKMDALQNRKKLLSENVIEEGEVFVNRLTLEELQEIFDM